LLFHIKSYLSLIVLLSLDDSCSFCILVIGLSVLSSLVLSSSRLSTLWFPTCWIPTLWFSTLCLLLSDTDSFITLSQYSIFLVFSSITYCLITYRALTISFHTLRNESS